MPPSHRVDTTVQVLLDAHEEAALLLDSAGHLLAYNAFALDLFDLSSPPTDALFLSLLPKPFALSLRQQIAQVLEHGESLSTRMDYRSRPFRVGFHPIDHNTEAARHIALFFHALPHDQPDFDAMQFWSRCVAIQALSELAHAINQPLHAITAYSEAALFMFGQPNPAPDRLKQAMQKTHEQAARAARISSDLLHRLQDLPPPTKHEIDLPPLLEHLATNFTSEGTAAPISIQFSGPAHPVLCDAILLQMTLSHLIHNAQDAVDALPASEKGIQIHAEFTPEQVHLQIRHRGELPDPAHVRTLFKPFFTTKAHHAGLGLPVIRSVIEAQGGKLWYEDSSGEIAFHFTLLTQPS